MSAFIAVLGNVPSAGRGCNWVFEPLNSRPRARVSQVVVDRRRVLATQNPMDVDYRVLSNTGLWYIGRLQTDADRERVIESLSQAAGTGALSPAALTRVVKQLKSRWFVMRDVHDKNGTVLVQPRLRDVVHARATHANGDSALDAEAIVTSLGRLRSPASTLGKTLRTSFICETMSSKTALSSALARIESGMWQPGFAKA